MRDKPRQCRVNRLACAGGWRVDQVRNAVPNPQQPVGDKGRAAIRRRARNPRRKPRAGCARDKLRLRVEHKNLKPVAKRQRLDRLDRVDPVIRGKIGRRRCRQPRLEHLGDQNRIRRQRLRPLMHQPVARGCEIKDTGGQNIQRNKVERDDPPRQRRAAQRDPAAPRPARPHLFLNGFFGRNPVIADDHIAVRIRRRCRRVPHNGPFAQSVA